MGSGVEFGLGTARNSTSRELTKEKRVASSPTTASAPVQIHSTAIVEQDVQIGAGTSVWDNVHIRRSARIGAQCIIGEKTYIAPGVTIADRVKINAFVYICSAVSIADGVMISAGVIFTNDRYPRATTPDLLQLRSSDIDEHTLPTFVREGATLGAGCRIGCDLVIGRFAMVGMGSVVTKSVPDFTLVVGTPARAIGYVCRCGQPLRKFNGAANANDGSLHCDECGRSYILEGGVVSEADGKI
jgi:UDP-2-acetamido-3-amino-2,3-dideoxy-glucuronate N-acetyltransferase